MDLYKTAASASGGDTSVETVADFFSTDLYTADGGTQVVQNGVDLAGEGGMVWWKCRSDVTVNIIHDSERGVANKLVTSSTPGEYSYPADAPTFLSDGYSIPLNGVEPYTNWTGRDYVTWTFRKAPKFFDIVTYAGLGIGQTFRNINHNLGSIPGMIIIKRLDEPSPWCVYHRSSTITDNFFLNTTSAAAGWNWISTGHTDTTFQLGSANLADVNDSGGQYVAYLFAHETDPDEGMIQCGSYTGNGAADGTEVDLGWEPQYVIAKRRDFASSWFIWDSLRGAHTGADATLSSDTAAVESISERVEFTATGFTLKGSSANSNGGSYIYMAIRAPMMKEPESADEVFALATADGQQPVFSSGFPVDMALSKNIGSGSVGFRIASRLTGDKYLHVADTAPAVTNSEYGVWDSNSRWHGNSGFFNPNFQSWMWKRSKGFFDVVAYDTISGGGTFNHSLGVAPELIITRRYDIDLNCYTKHKDLSGYLHLNEDVAVNPSDFISSTDTHFTITNGWLAGSGAAIAYLFATVAGVSKVGSYIGNGSDQTINCGFSSGARFILIKRSDSAGDWFVWDTLRGIVAENDSHLSLNSAATPVFDDSVDPNASGFRVVQDISTNINVSNGEYIFYAIA